MRRMYWTHQALVNMLSQPWLETMINSQDNDYNDPPVKCTPFNMRECKTLLHSTEVHIMLKKVV